MTNCTDPVLQSNYGMKLQRQTCTQIGSGNYHATEDSSMVDRHEGQALKFALPRQRKELTILFYPILVVFCF
ncbi:unnamed protein product [Urochloa humidicola]